MYFKNLEINGFKSFGKKSVLDFESLITAIVGPNGSGKSNVVEAVRFVLGEQSMKSLRGKGGTDLIFKGSKNLNKLNRASVTINFNNRKRVFVLPSLGNINLDFEEISITREVHTDGSNRYLSNGSEVRLKDIMEMLSSVNISSSGHHIISQGEADRILNASPKERREMIEDALGLKIYRYRMRESIRKIDRTKDNIKEIGILRREIAPHLNFLKKQVEKIEKAAELKSELGRLYEEYLKREEIYLAGEKKEVHLQKSALESKLGEIEKGFSEVSAVGERTESAVQKNLFAEEREVAEFRGTKDGLSRKLGRIEGLLELKESKIKMSGKCPVCGAAIVKREEDVEELAELKAGKDKIISELASLTEKEGASLNKIREFQAMIEKEKEDRAAGDVRKLELQMEKNKILSELNLIKIRSENFNRIESDFLNEIKEGSVLVGPAIMQYKSNISAAPLRSPDLSGRRGVDQSSAGADRIHQEERRKKIEKIKIRLEDMGEGGGEETLKEYDETSLRDRFLAKELEDLNKTIQSLEEILVELKAKIETEFMSGIEKINKQFQEFFQLMFGGGSASISVIEIGKKVKEELALQSLARPAEPWRSGDEALESDLDEDELAENEDEEKESEIGILINVSLPQKKVKALQALSGGERSLTSIALLFATSQVNPPPFLVLDETDAALDEANSKKYGDMLERLAKYSQLILVTHNRETMSRAGVLYGVTIGSDGASKLLSIKLEEAVVIAK